MKRKLIAILLAVFTAFACVPAFAAGDLLISPAPGVTTAGIPTDSTVLPVIQIPNAGY